MMAYACCVKRRVASADPLSEHNSAFDIRGQCGIGSREERRGRRRARVLPLPHLVGKQGLDPAPGVRGTIGAWSYG